MQRLLVALLGNRDMVTRALGQGATADAVQELGQQVSKKAAFALVDEPFVAAPHIGRELQEDIRGMAEELNAERLDGLL